MRKFVLPVALLAASLAFVLHPGSAQAQASRTWVSGVGDDANPCSRTAPCKTFAGAISKTAASGEIDCLDPGGFGAVTITKAMTIDCTGTFGSVLVSGTNGIVVQAGASDKVILRGIAIQGLAENGLNGISFLSGAQLSVERCIILGFSQNGINISLAASADVFVTNTYITNSNEGIRVSNTAGSVAVMVDHTTLANLSSAGFEMATGNGFAVITNSVISSNGGGSGISTPTAGAQVSIDTSSIFNIGFALNAGASSTIRISNNNIYNNGTNFSIGAGATIASDGTNRTTPAGAGVPNATITLK